MMGGIGQAAEAGPGQPQTRPVQREAIGGPGVADNIQPDLGAQLSHRVQSGALSQVDAMKVAAQRALFEKQFGPNWRQVIFGKGGARGITGPFAEREIAAKRSKALAAARSKRLSKGVENAWGGY
jgi:hypothetical protein